jgi:hypothetical protein
MHATLRTLKDGSIPAGGAKQYRMNMTILRNIYLIKGLSRTKVRMSELESGDIFEMFEPDNNEFVGTFKFRYNLDSNTIRVYPAPFTEYNND